MAASLWRGPERLVLALDIGTSSSAVAVAWLRPGVPVRVLNVAEWPAQQPDLARVPSLMLYAPDGQAMAFGSEVLEPGVERLAHSRRWQLAHRALRIARVALILQASSCSCTQSGLGRTARSRRRSRSRPARSTARSTR